MPKPFSLEPIARAIWNAMVFGGNSADFSAQPKQIRDHYYGVAQAAVEAMPSTIIDQKID